VENQTDQLMLALMEVHKEFGVIISKDRKGHKGTYASLPSVLESLHTANSKHGLILTQASCILEGKNALLTTLSHPSSKQSISSVSLLTPHPDPQSHDQAWGGSSTYHRRYDAMMIMGLFSDEDPTDHDGNYDLPKSMPIKNNLGCINEKQLGLLKVKLNGDKKIEDAILARLGLSDLSQIPWQKFNEIIKYLDGK
jgi:hypothetical protein